MLRPYLKIWEWERIFGHLVKAISSLGVRSPWVRLILGTLAGKLHELVLKSMKHKKLVKNWFFKKFQIVHPLFQILAIEKWVEKSLPNNYSSINLS